jgi:hypothetical protein
MSTDTNVDPVVTDTSTTTAGTSAAITVQPGVDPETATDAQVTADPSLSPASTAYDQAYAAISPDFVSANTRGGTITRSQVIARARSWVAEHVPYNQRATWTDANGTYRQDCSGYVSMAWNLPSSRTTWTLDESSVTTRISRSQLKPGDALDYAAEHVVLFGGWKDQSAGTFYYYAESNPSVLTKEYVGNFNSSTIAGWPVSDYVCLRFNKIVDDAATVAANTFYHEVRNTDGTWTGFKAPAGYDGAATFAGAQESIAAMPNGDAQLLGLGKDGSIYHNIRYSKGTWQGWKPVDGANGASHFSGPDMAITGMPNGSSQIVAIGLDGNIWHNIRSAAGAWQGWRRMTGANGATSFAASKVAIAGMPDDSAQVIAYGNNGNMYLTTRSASGTWSDWQELTGANGAAGFAGPDLAIAAMPDGSAQILAIGKDGNIYHGVRTTDGAFSGWGHLAGLGTSYMAASSIGITGMPNGTSQVTAIGKGSDTYHAVRNTNGTWTDFQPLHGINGATKFAGHQVAIAGMPNGTSQVLATTAG